MKSYKEKVSEYYNNMLDLTQSEDKLFKETSFRYYEKNHKPLLPKDKNAKILEMGCGRGFFLEFLSNSGYTNIQGIDNNSINIQKCINRGVNAKCIDIFEFLAQNDEKYDCVVMLHVLEHFPKEEGYRLLTLINNLLAKKGSVIIEVPNMGNPITASRGRYMDITHEIGFTQESIEFILKLADFSSIQVKPANIFVLENNFFNIMGLLAHKFFSIVMKILFLLNGVKTTTIFTKSIIVSASKE